MNLKNPQQIYDELMEGIKTITEKAERELEKWLQKRV